MQNKGFADFNRGYIGSASAQSAGGREVATSVSRKGGDV